MKFRKLNGQLRPATALLFCLLCCTVCPGCQTNRAKHDQNNLTPQQIRKIVNEINLIRGLAQKQDEPQWDEHAWAIVKLGKKAAPYLVQKITDSTPSRVVEFFPYKIGDLALVLLQNIYGSQGWPFPDASTKIPIKYRDFRDYTDFINSPGARQTLKRRWKKYIKDH